MVNMEEVFGRDVRSNSARARQSSLLFKLELIAGRIIQIDNGFKLLFLLKQYTRSSEFALLPGSTAADHGKICCLHERKNELAG